MMMFQDGGQPVYGPLATDRPHQFKTQFIYQLPFGTSVGPEPVRRERPAGHARDRRSIRRQQLPVQYLGRGSDGRTPTFSQTDLLLQHGFRIRQAAGIQVSLNVLNLFNQTIAVSKFSTSREQVE